MDTKDASGKPASEDDLCAREAAANSLRRQIKNLKDREPRTLNEFAERKAAEDCGKGDETD